MRVLYFRLENSLFCSIRCKLKLKTCFILSSSPNRCVVAYANCERDNDKEKEKTYCKTTTIPFYRLHYYYYHYYYGAILCVCVCICCRDTATAAASTARKKRKFFTRNRRQIRTPALSWNGSRARAPSQARTRRPTHIKCESFFKFVSHFNRHQSTNESRVRHTNARQRKKCHFLCFFCHTYFSFNLFILIFLSLSSPSSVFQ